MKNMLARWKQKISNKASAEKISAAIAVIGLYGLMQLVGITCPIKYVTGISCVGCGMTRAWLAFLRLDFGMAFYYHPLFFMSPLVIFLFLLKPKINIKIYKNLVFTSALLFAIIYLLRMISGDNDVVVFRPEDGLLFQLVKFFT